MSLESQPIRVPGNTRICTLPFTTPSIEPDGGVRLCSAASIFNYLDETMMGSIHHGGLETVWRNQKFRKLRQALLTGDALAPYCHNCDYRFEGPPWLLVFHLALLTYNRAKEKDADIADLIRRYEHRYPEYRQIAGSHGLGVEPLPERLERAKLRVVDLLAGKPRSLVMRGDAEWVDVTVPVPADLAPLLADPLRAERAELAIGWRQSADGEAQAPNLRVSIEESAADRIRYTFLPVATPTLGAHSVPLQQFVASVADFAPKRVVRVRVGGFGTTGSTIELHELALLLPEDVAAPVKLAGIDKLVEGSRLPVQIDLNTLNRCNVSCTMCPYAIKYDDRGEPKEAIYRLTLDEYKAITHGMNVESAHFVGAYAEPLMNKELFVMIAHADAQGTRTAVTSNAMLLSRKFAEKLVDSGLGLLTISLHGATKAVAEGIMRGSEFETVLGNIRTLQEVKRERGVTRPTLQINYVGQKANVHELPAFVRLADSLGIRIIHFVHLLVTPGVKESESLVNHPEELTRSVREAEKIARKLGVQLYISPSYSAVIADFERGARAGV